MKYILALRSSLLAVVVLATGCRSMFPTEDRQTHNQWHSFEEAQLAFDKVVPHKTTIQDLKGLGLDPHSSPNIKLLNYLDVINRFIPNQSIVKDDLPCDVLTCITAKDCCQAYELNLEVVDNKRYGNLFLDAFNFKKKTRITGWNFKGLIVIQDGMVTYKLASGEPLVNRLEKKVRPLGPFQELDGLVTHMHMF
jgi:hypothetical protein